MRHRNVKTWELALIYVGTILLSALAWLLFVWLAVMVVKATW